MCIIDVCSYWNCNVWVRLVICFRWGDGSLVIHRILRICVCCGVSYFLGYSGLVRLVICLFDGEMTFS